MAGSYDHCRGEHGHFQMDLIENLGDAHEALDMMYYMIGELSGGDQDKIEAAKDEYYKRIGRVGGPVLSVNCH